MNLGTLLVVAGLAAATGAGTTQARGQSTHPGVSRELAQSRATRISGVQYELSYTLLPHAAETQAHEALRFELKDAEAPVPLDFRDGKVQQLSVNGNVIPAQVQNGHLMLPGASLRTGENRVEIDFVASVAPAEKAITRFEDHDDGSEYIYTLFVPMDASMAFPCFDQPDLKARFTLQMKAPKAWTVISNTAAVSTAQEGDLQRTAFAQTEPISTYLFAFAAGPFVKVHPAAGMPGVYVRKSKAAAAEREGTAASVQSMAAQGIEFLSTYFAQPFPFQKYDMVLIPGFAYGGMEHAGATFLREESVLFRTAPTATNLLNRDVLVLHELTHQWFGDFTTMRWFDDLWLKEGFAQYMAYKALAAMRPNDNIPKRFYQAIKPAAYAIDETQGTTPIYQDIANLADAKSAYGAIVYSKAPGVLRQLEFVIGEDAFRNGLRMYLAQHRYGNAAWSDLIGAFEKASSKSLEPWAGMWIRHRGMPQVDAEWSCSAGKLQTLTLRQHDTLGGNDLWPIATEVALGYPNEPEQTVRAEFASASAKVELGGQSRACPAYVFANHDDHAYGLFPLDARSEEYLSSNIKQKVPDLFERTLLWGALWDGVRAAQFSPEKYVDVVLAQVEQEQDESLVASLVGRAETAVHRYVRAAARAGLEDRIAELAADRMMHSDDKDLRIVWFRALGGAAQGEHGRELVKQLLGGKAEVPGVALRQQDRWNLVTVLIAYGDPQADQFLAAEKQRDASGDGRKFAYVAEAARPDAGTKKKYFEDYLNNADRQEDWIESSLGAFNFWTSRHSRNRIFGRRSTRCRRSRRIAKFSSWWAG